MSALAKLDLIVVYRSLAYNDPCRLCQARWNCSNSARASRRLASHSSSTPQTSIGRLTLQRASVLRPVEREVIPMRIRDKIACLQTKGALESAVPSPLGYQMRPTRSPLSRDEAEASTPDSTEAISETRRRERHGTRPPETRYPNKSRTARNGVTRGGVPFGRGSYSICCAIVLYWRGEYKDETLPGASQRAIHGSCAIDA